MARRVAVGDQVQVDLTCKWFAHFVAENWTETSVTDTDPEYSDWLATYAFQDIPTTYTLQEHWEASHMFRTSWNIDTPSIISFAIHRWHIGDLGWRNEIGLPLSQCTLEPPQTQYVSQTNPDWFGNYGVRVRIVGAKHSGTFTIRNALGNSETRGAWIVPATSWIPHLECAPDQRL